jgi:hypothetical protein
LRDFGDQSESAHTKSTRDGSISTQEVFGVAIAPAGGDRTNRWRSWRRRPCQGAKERALATAKLDDGGSDVQHDNPPTPPCRPSAGQQQLLLEKAAPPRPASSAASPTMSTTTPTASPSTSPWAYVYPPRAPIAAPRSPRSAPKPVYALLDCVLTQLGV